MPSRTSPSVLSAVTNAAPPANASVVVRRGSDKPRAGPQPQIADDEFARRQNERNVLLGRRIDGGLQGGGLIAIVVWSKVERHSGGIDGGRARRRLAFRCTRSGRDGTEAEACTDKGTAIEGHPAAPVFAFSEANFEPARQTLSRG